MEAPSGDRALCLFRPEDVEIGADGPGRTATVDVKVFLGAVTRVYATHEGTTVFADVPSRAAASLEDGQKVFVRVAPEHVRVFAA